MSDRMEIRHLQPAIVAQLGTLLDERQWKRVMAALPQVAGDGSLLPTTKYTAEHIRLVEAYANSHNKSCTEIMLNEWGTSGRIRPTLRALIDVLTHLKLYRVANYLMVDVLQQSPIISDVIYNLDASGVIHVPYSILTEITGQWDDTPFSDGPAGGHRLGSGAFGTVYYGMMPNGTQVAVKKLKDDTVALFNQFQSEITTLSNYRHKNLVPLLGYSQDSGQYCLVYEFMSNRSLEDHLEASRQNSASYEPLSWLNRMIIAVGICEGIHYLHTACSPPLIHRDVKAANILLDGQMQARLGDFGLVRTLPADTRITSTIFGTSAYMAPEAFRGDVSVKTDVFSVGVVLLELLTALSPYDVSREGADLVTYVEETVEGQIEPLLDPKADWEIAIAEAVFNIAQICISEKKKRPVMIVVINLLREVLEGVSNV